MKKQATVFLSLIFFAVGCGDITRSGPGRPPAPVALPPASAEGGASSPGEVREKVTFAQIDEPILKPKCAGCRGRAGGYSVRSFVGTVSRVVSGKPESSVLYQRVANGSMPPRGDALTGEELQLIRRWIEDGALEN